MSLNESTIEVAALTWFETLGYSVHTGLEIAPGELLAERTTYAETVLVRRLRDSLVRHNPTLPPKALTGLRCNLFELRTLDPLLPNLPSWEVTRGQCGSNIGDHVNMSHPSPAPTGRHKLAQGKAERRPGYAVPRVSQALKGRHNPWSRRPSFSNTRSSALLGLDRPLTIEPRALPWAGISRPFGAFRTNIRTYCPDRVRIWITTQIATSCRDSHTALWQNSES